MKRFGLAVAGVVVVVFFLVAGHFALIEIGREVVTVRTPLPNDGWEQTRLWAVDHDGAVWLHSAGDAWLARFEGTPIVELRRGGETRRYRARPVPGPHPRIDELLREKYGLADRWVRFLVPCDESVVPVRLDPAPGE